MAASDETEGVGVGADEARRPLWWYARLLRRLRPRGARLLQVDCGAGALLGLLVDHFEVYGFDSSAKARRQCRMNVPGALVIEDWESRPDIAFDVVVSIGAFGRRGARAQIRALLSTLAAGGVLVLVVPNPSGWGARWKGRVWGAEDADGETLLSDGEWKTLLRTMGLRIEGLYADGLWDGPYLSWLPAQMQNSVFDAAFAAATLVSWPRPWMPRAAGESLVLAVSRDR